MIKETRLCTWLEVNDKMPTSYSNFKTIDVDEISNNCSEDILYYISDLFGTHIFRKEFLKEINDILKWEKVQEYIDISSILPTQSNIKKGDFGEILFSSILEEFHDYIIPVTKIQYKIIPNQSLPRTDILALRIKDNLINEVCYVESKLRTTNDTYAAVEAHDQLKEDYNTKMPEILIFVLRILSYKNSPLLPKFKIYMQDRKDNKNYDTFRISLCWEKSKWSDTVLKNLDDNGVKLSKLHVHVIKINNLSNLVDKIYGLLEARLKK